MGLIFVTSGIATFIAGVLFGATELQMVVTGLLFAAFLGAFNVFEPKAVEQQLEVIRKLYESH